MPTADAPPAQIGVRRGSRKRRQNTVSCWQYAQSYASSSHKHASSCTAPCVQQIRGSWEFWDTCTSYMLSPTACACVWQVDILHSPAHALTPWPFEALRCIALLRVENTTMMHGACGRGIFKQTCNKRYPMQTHWHRWKLQQFQCRRACWLSAESVQAQGGHARSQAHGSMRLLAVPAASLGLHRHC
jgi:hypothetical protein